MLDLRAVKLPTKKTSPYFLFSKSMLSRWWFSQLPNVGFLLIPNEGIPIPWEFYGQTVKTSPAKPSPRWGLPTPLDLQSNHPRHRLPSVQTVGCHVKAPDFSQRRWPGFNFLGWDDYMMIFDRSWCFKVVLWPIGVFFWNIILDVH